MLTLLALSLLAGEATSPNIVLVVTDDQGYGDFSHAGHGALETPRIDAFAKECPQVARFYVSPVCSPTRASLMTGRWNYRTGVVDTWIGRSMMDTREVTIAEILREAGYSTGIFGKWHLGDCFPMRPMDQGFDDSLVHRGGGIAQPSEPPANGRRYTDPILYRNGVETETEGYCTDVYFDAALDFIDDSLEAEKPFFAYVATNAPHGPFHDVPEELLAKYQARDLEPTLRGKSDKTDREARICAMVENIDQNVGKLLDHLDEREVARDTIVVFLCDNGPVWGRYTRGLRGAKTQPYEGGIRSPLFVRWPGRISAETEVARISAHIDVLPTLLEFAGVEAPEGVAFDGRSLAPLLRGEEVAWPDRLLFLQSHRGNAPAAEHHFAVVGSRWKLVRASGFGKQAADEEHPFELFDLAIDPAETNDVSEKVPDVVERLRGAYRDWFADVSRSRPNGWAPPRIVLDDDAEPVTTLTRQDIRYPRGEGWASEREVGKWHVRVDQARFTRTITAVFNESRRVERAVLHIGDRERGMKVRAEGDRIHIGEFSLSPGEYEIGLELYDGGELVPVHQVELAVED